MHTLVGHEALELHESLQRTSRHVDTIGRHVDVDHASGSLVGQKLSADGTSHVSKNIPPQLIAIPNRSELKSQSSHTGVGLGWVGGTAELGAEVGPGQRGLALEQDQGVTLLDEWHQLVGVEWVQHQLSLTQQLELAQVRAT